jgi:DNA-directed RNA polymerase subunit K/omega
MADMDEVNEVIEEPGSPLVPEEPAPPIQSRFLFVDVAALRAKQLRRGARPRLEGDQIAPIPHKAERLAMEEVRRGLVFYEVPEPRAAGSEGP